MRGKKKSPTIWVGDRRAHLFPGEEWNTIQGPDAGIGSRLVRIASSHVNHDTEISRVKQTSGKVRKAISDLRGTRANETGCARIFFPILWDS